MHVGRVKRALKKRLEETGIPYSDSNQLIEDVLRDQVMEDDSTRSVYHLTHGSRLRVDEYVTSLYVKRLMMKLNLKVGRSNK